MWASSARVYSPCSCHVGGHRHSAPLWPAISPTSMRRSKRASAHNRVAIGYLRTGNIDLATLEIDRLREAWGQVRRSALPASGRTPSTAIRSMPVYGPAVSARLVGADLMLKIGRADAAANALKATARRSLRTCARPAASWCWPTACATPTPQWTRSMVYDDRALDWSKPETRYAIAAQGIDLRSPARPLRRHRERRGAQGTGIPPPDRRRPRRPRVHSEGNRHPRHRPCCIAC